MGPQPDQSVDGQGFQRPNGLADASNPSGHLPGTVDVVRLHVLRELLLRPEVEFDHGRRQRVGVRSQRWHHAEHCTVECAVDLLEGRLAGVVDVDDRNVPQEPEIENQF